MASNRLRLKVLRTAVNRVSLHVDLRGNRLARIYRADRIQGPYEAVGVAYEETFDDTTYLKPGRTYRYCAVGSRALHLVPERDELRGIRGVAATVPRTPKARHATLTKCRAEFTIKMEGTVDESNSVTMGPEVYCPGPNSSMPPYDQIFEPNVYVAIENVGDSDLVNPWVVANGRRDWWSIDSMAREAIDGRTATEEDKMMAIWRFVVEEVYDSRAGLSWFDDMSDPVKLFNIYGFEGCVGYAIATSRLAEAVGLRTRNVWVGGMLDGHGRGRNCSHTIFEAYCEGAWHLLDTDQMVFFLSRDNRTVAGVEKISMDGDLIRRSHRNLGLAGKDLPDKIYYDEQFKRREFVYPPNRGGASEDERGGIRQGLHDYPPEHTMALKLRPGEKLVRYWENIGKNVVRGRRLHPDVRYSNGKLVYEPDLRKPIVFKGMESRSNLVQETGRGRAAIHAKRMRSPASATWRIQSPYAIAGARVGLSYRRPSREDGLELLLSLDGENWRSVWMASGHRADACVELDWFLNPALNDWRKERDQAWHLGPCYQYFIKVAIWAGSNERRVGLDSIRFDTDIQCATRSLPSLFCGQNRVTYRDETRGRRKVRLTYGWQEERDIQPPGQPEPVFPRDGQDLDCLDFEFRWRKLVRGPRIDDHHIQVSRYSDFRWCVCPTFDRYLSRTKYAGRAAWQAEFPNLLNPGETYFWRVRARGAKGVWGTWSRGSSFVPHGPKHPVKLETRSKNGARWLTWLPNTSGNQPVAYRIYGSVESGGFSVSEACLLVTVEESKWRMGKRRKRPMSYRVVAVDANGVPSTPSDYVVV